MGVQSSLVFTPEPLADVTLPDLADRLSADEKRDLAQHEARIKDGMKIVFDVALALTGIRNGRLYRETHKTFELYCDERWGFTKTHANRMIAGASVLEDLTPIGAKPKNIEQTKPLTRLKPEQRREAWAVAQERAAGKEVTAFDLEQAAAKVAPKVSKMAPPPTKEQLVKAKRARVSREQRERKRQEELDRYEREKLEAWENDIIVTRSPKERWRATEIAGRDLEKAIAKVVAQGKYDGDIALFRSGRLLAVVVWKDGLPVTVMTENIIKQGSIEAAQTPKQRKPRVAPKAPKRPTQVLAYGQHFRTEEEYDLFRADPAKVAAGEKLMRDRMEGFEPTACTLESRRIIGTRQVVPAKQD